MAGRLSRPSMNTVSVIVPPRRIGRRLHDEQQEARHALQVLVSSGGVHGWPGQRPGHDERLVRFVFFVCLVVQTVLLWFPAFAGVTGYGLWRAGCVSAKRTGTPAPSATRAPSRMIVRPRMIVATGQPVVVMPP